MHRQMAVARSIFVDHGTVSKQQIIRDVAQHLRDSAVEAAGCPHTEFSEYGLRMQIVADDLDARARLIGGLRRLIF